MEILDTAGAEQFSIMRDLYMKKVTQSNDKCVVLICVVQGEAFLLCYDITNRRSFSEVASIYAELCSVRNEEEPLVVLVGNKCDLEVRFPARPPLRPCTSPVLPSYGEQ